MRILRGKSNLEVSSQGFAWLVLGLVIATFVGGAVRTILTSDRVHQRIVTELRNRFPQHQFQIGQTEVLLSRGLWPGLGLRLRNLSFKQEVCGKLSFELVVPQAMLPVDLLSLRKGKVRLGRVELNDGRFHFNYRPCIQESVVSTPPPAAGGVAPMRPAIVAPTLDWQKVSKHLDAIELNNFVLTYERNVTWKVLVPSMQLELGEDMSAQGTMEIQKSLPFGALTHTVDIEAQGDDHVLQWGVHSEFKEGTFHLKGSLDMNNHAAIVQVNARQLPLRDVMSELHQMGFVESDLHLKSTWLSCTVKWEGPLARPYEAPIQTNGCKIEGGYGRVELESAEFWLDHPEKLKKETVLKVSKLQVQPVLEALGRQVLPRVLVRPGVWTGKLVYLDPRVWSLDGHLENAEVVFSNRSVRGKQMVERLRSRVKRGGSLIEATIDEVQLHGGEFAGQLQFALADDWRSGNFKVDIEKLRFSPSIQNLLVGGTFGDLKLSGQGALQAGELGRWDGEITVDQVSGLGWESRDIQIKSHYTPGVFHLEGRAKEGKIKPDWRAFSQLQSVRSETSAVVGWRSLTARVDIHSGGGTIHSAVGIEEESEQPWRLKGTWVRDGHFNALLSVDQGKGRNYALRGEKGQLTVQGPLR